MTAPDPVAFTIFGIDVMWYGVLIAIGFVLAIVISYFRAPALGIKRENVLDLAIWLIPFSVIGARLYYIIFTWNEMDWDLKSAIDIRSGGLAVHGGLIAGLIVGLILCGRKKIFFFDLADLVFPSVALAQAIGRWGNFFNSEAHGGPTDLPWAIIVDGQKVHPTFLYESLWCFFLFIFLTAITRKRKFRGQIAALYGMLYSVERCLVEQLRTDSLMIGPFRQAQVISISIFAISLLLYLILRKKYPLKNKRSRRYR